MRYELGDYEWAAIKPMLPNKPRGVPRVNDRRVLNGIFRVLRSGAPWRDLPSFARVRSAPHFFCDRLAQALSGHSRPSTMRTSRSAALLNTFRASW
jgi:transposase